MVARQTHIWQGHQGANSETGRDSSGNYGIGYTTSSDGISWTKYASNPVLTAGAAGTSV